jgi:hypothetical protein
VVPSHSHADHPSPPLHGNGPRGCGPRGWRNHSSLTEALIPRLLDRLLLFTKAPWLVDDFRQRKFNPSLSLHISTGARRYGRYFTTLVLSWTFCGWRRGFMSHPGTHQEERGSQGLPETLKKHWNLFSSEITCRVIALLTCFSGDYCGMDGYGSVGSAPLTIWGYPDIFGHREIMKLQVPTHSRQPH